MQIKNGAPVAPLSFLERLFAIVLSRPQQAQPGVGTHGNRAIVGHCFRLQQHQPRRQILHPRIQVDQAVARSPGNGVLGTGVAVDRLADDQAGGVDGIRIGEASAVQRAQAAHARSVMHEGDLASIAVDVADDMAGVVDRMGYRTVGVGQHAEVLEDAAAVAEGAAGHRPRGRAH